MLGLSEDNYFINAQMLYSQRQDRTTMESGGVTVGAGSLYVFDRWYTSSPVTGFVIEALTTTSSIGNAEGYFSQKVTSNGISAASYMSSVQKFEDYLAQELNGRVITISCWMRSNSNYARLGYYDGTNTYVSPDTHVGGGAWQYMTFTFEYTYVSAFHAGFYVGDESSGLLADTALNSSLYFEFALPKVEIGSRATAFRPRDPGIDLYQCQRFFEKSYDIGTALGTATILGETRQVSFNTVNTMLLTQQYKVTKRGTPNVAMYSPATGTGSYIYNYSAAADNALSSIFGVGESSFSFSATITAGDQVIGYHWYVDAEL